MPKIIENVREQLLTEAKKQIAERGYANTTIRSVAKECGVGVGTVYNYFESKEMLVATFVFESWKAYLSSMARLPSDEPRVLLKGIYDLLIAFSAENKSLFSDLDAAKLVATGSSSRHKMLRSQIASFIVPLCKINRLDDPEFAAEFISESIICWSMENEDFETVYPLIEKIIKK